MVIQTSQIDLFVSIKNILKKRLKNNIEIDYAFNKL